MSRACICGHGGGEHKSTRERRCMLCQCKRFEAHRPPVLDDRQADMLEDKAHGRARVFDAVRDARTVGRLGLTFEEVRARTGLNPNTVRARLSELRAEGVLDEAPFLRKVGGRRLTVYRLADAPRPAPSPVSAAVPAAVPARAPKRFEVRETMDGRRVAVEVGP